MSFDILEKWVDKNKVINKCNYSTEKNVIRYNDKQDHMTLSPSNNIIQILIFT